MPHDIRDTCPHQGLPAITPRRRKQFIFTRLKRATLSRYLMVVGTLYCLALLSAGPVVALQPLRIGTGGQTGVYYPIGTLIAEGITRHTKQSPNLPDDLIGVSLVSAGSVENARKIAAGELEAGLVQADIASFAIEGGEPFQSDEGPLPIKAIASLYPEYFQLVVRRDAGINHVQDIKGKRLSIDEEGSGSLAVTRIVLAEHRMSERDLQPLYLKPVFFEEKMKTGQIQGFTLMAGAPMQAVHVLQDIGVTLIGLDDSIIERIHHSHPYLVPGRIPAGTYPGVPEIATVSVNALLVVHESMPEQLAYGIAEALFSDETARLLQDGHFHGRSITAATALHGLSIPLHPGAEKFFRHHNLLDHSRP